MTRREGQISTAASPSAAVLERFEDRLGRDDSASSLPGEGSMWVFVLGDLVIFGVYFLIYAVARAQDPSAYLEAQQSLGQGLGLLNTLVLLTSSWLVARSVLRARAGARRDARRYVIGAAACGVVFLAVKAVEWSRELRAGHTLASDDFFAFYYVLTGVHVLHVLIGLIIAGVVITELGRRGRGRVATVESGGVYWHMVDLLWLLIYALLYLMR